MTILEITEFFWSSMYKHLFPLINLYDAKYSMEYDPGVSVTMIYKVENALVIQYHIKDNDIYVSYQKIIDDKISSYGDPVNTLRHAEIERSMKSNRTSTSFYNGLTHEIQPEKIEQIAAVILQYGVKIIQGKVWRENLADLLI